MPNGLKHRVAKQGIFDSKKGIQIGVELLSRWIDSNGQALAPGQLKNINWAEIDLQVIKQIGEFIKQENTCDTLFFINVSKELLSHYQLFDIWLMITQELAQRYGPCFVIEITEGISPKLLEKNYSKLRATGAKLAIDDFGDGYSDELRLKGFGWDFCKVSFMNLSNPASFASIADCERLGVKVIIEEIENLDSKEAAQSNNLLLHQGFYWQIPTF